MADVFFKGLGLLLKFMAKAGVMHFAEAGGGLTVGLTGQIVGAAMTVGAIANHLQQNPQRDKDKDKRPPKERVLIIERAKSPEAIYKHCVDREWDVFKQNVEKINQAAEDAGFWRSIWIKVGSILPGQWPDIPGQGPPPTMPTEGPEAANAIQKQKEKEERTKQAADKREEAIKNNCKKPT